MTFWYEIVLISNNRFQSFQRLRVDRRKRSETDQWIRVDGKHSMRLQNVNVYVWTGPETLRFKSFDLSGIF